MVEHHRTVGDTFGLVQFVGGNHHTATPLGEFAQDHANLGAPVHVHPGRGFVEECHVRTCGKGHSERKALALTAAQPTPRGARACREANPLDESIGPLTAAVEITEQPGDVHHPCRGVHAAVLEHDAHPLGEPTLIGGRIQPEHGHPAAARRAESLAHLDGGGLPRTVRAKNRRDAPGLSGERDAVNGNELAVTHPQVFDDDSRIGHGIDATGGVPDPGK